MALSFTRPRPLAAFAALSLVAALLLAAAVLPPAHAAASVPALTPAQSRYLALAQAGVARAQATW